MVYGNVGTWLLSRFFAPFAPFAFAFVLVILTEDEEDFISDYPVISEKHVVGIILLILFFFFSA